MFNVAFNTIGQFIGRVATFGQYQQLEEAGDELLDGYLSIQQKYMYERRENSVYATENVEQMREIAALKKENETLYSRIDSLLNVIDEMGEVLDKTLAERDYARDTLKDIGREVDLLLCDAGVYDEVEYIYDEKERDKDGVILGSKEHLRDAYNRYKEVFIQ